MWIWLVSGMVFVLCMRLLSLLISMRMFIRCLVYFWLDSGVLFCLFGNIFFKWCVTVWGISSLIFFLKEVIFFILFDETKLICGFVIM